INKGGSPHGVYGESMSSLRDIVHGVHETLFEHCPWSPLYFRKCLWTPCAVHEDCAWSAHGLHVDCRKYSHGLHGLHTECSWSAHGVLMECSWSPTQRVGECKVLPNTQHTCSNF